MAACHTFPVIEKSHADLRRPRPVFSQPNVSHLHHQLRRPVRISTNPALIQINDFLNAALNDNFGAIVTREQCDIDPRAADVTGVLVEDGVHLRVADVSILLITPIGNEIENFRSGASN